MREIKFRAIHKLTKKKWDEEDLVFHSGKWYENWRAFEDGIPLNLQQCAVMQYTGLKDKNGVEIYEGDIVTATFWDDEQKIYSETAIVDFEEGSFILKLSNDEWSYFNGTQSVEVIGNIHEHPHLLEVSTE